jgi:hypothetical protein
MAAKDTFNLPAPPAAIVRTIFRIARLAMVRKAGPMIVEHARAH